MSEKQTPMASENLELGAQISNGIKVAAWVAAVVVVVTAIATFMVWFSPTMAAWITGKP